MKTTPALVAAAALLACPEPAALPPDPPHAPQVLHPATHRPLGATLTEMTVYEPTRRSAHHVCMWGTRTVLGCTEPELRGHWLQVSVVETGYTFKAPVVGSMPRHRPSRSSKALHRRLDLLSLGWTDHGFGAYGCLDVTYVDLGDRR